MGKKKLKTGKKTKRKAGLTEDVRAATSLPPSVDGQLRCFLRVTASKISWVLTKPPEVFWLRLKWWGEQSTGSLFRPSDGREDTKYLVKKTARFPIRCGPKQFAEYLNAMSVCVFELVKGGQMTSIGKATVSELGLLTPQNPISGTYPIFSNQKADKLADLTVSMKFEPLPVSYDSSSSVPTTDASLPVPSEQISDTGSTQPSVLKKPRKTSRQSSLSQQAPTSGNEAGNRGKVTPSGVDNDYSFVVGPGAGGYRNMVDEALRGPTQDELPQRMTGTDTTVSDTATDSMSIPRVASSQVRDRFELPPTSDAGKELISAILEKGNKLMDSMIRVQCELQPKGPGPEGSYPGPLLEQTAPVPLRRSSSGDLFRELLKEGVSPEKINVYPVTEEDGKDALDPTLKLVVKDEITDKEMKKLKIRSSTSPVGSVDSDISDVMDVLTTDSDDPLHEDSILEELFYKGHRSSSDSEGLSDILLSSDSETEVPPRKQKKTRKGMHIKKRATKDISNRLPQDAEQPESEMKEEREARDTQEDDKMNDSETNDDSYDTSSVATLLHQSLHGVEGLSVQRLTLLGRIHAAKVSIDMLTLTQTTSGDAVSSKSKIPRRIPGDAKVKGKPPRPHEKSTYFVEYQFPVMASSQDSDFLSSMATEVTRIVSKKVTEKNGKVEVQFGHHSVFPIQFDGSTVDHWWTRLLVLRIYHKLAGQKTPSLIAVSSIPLKNIIKSPNLSVNVDLPVKRKLPDSQQTSSTTVTTDSTVTSPEERIPELGKIQISVELASDSKDFKSALARTKLAEMQGAKLISLPTVKKEHAHYVSSKSKDKQASKLNDSISSTPRVIPQKAAPRDEIRGRDGVAGQRGDRIIPRHQEKSPEKLTYPDSRQEVEHQTLFTLLLIPEGRGLTIQGKKPLSSTSENHPNLVPTPSNLINSPPSLQGHRDFVTRNPYLLCKMFWSDDAVHSHVCWGTSEPNFNFSQVAPVLLTPSLLERTRNNFMVVEVWDKKTSGQNDELIGIAKLPLHQFYMSFRDQKIATAILKSQYPVVGIDNYAPVINPFTGVHYGQIKVLLAMGASHQVSSLQRLKGDISLDNSKPERPVHYLERSEKSRNQALFPSSDDVQQSTLQVEHIFEVVIEGIRSLPQGEDVVWGEADCFVQYHFPSQEKQYNHLQGSLNLRSFRSATTLCLPDPTFNEVTRHRISLPQSVPVQRELLTACAGVGGAGGSIPFEVWCRYYYPNVRDQVMAKASLPLAKLCAMVTMQRRGEPSVQTFNLPLRALQEDSEEEEKQIMAGGFLDVTISYKQSTVKTESPINPLTMSTFPSVTLSITLYRATGLQAAAVTLARYYSELQYASDVGVNTFATVGLTFLPKEEAKKSRTIARSFSPELSHQVDFSCPLVLHMEGEVGDMLEQEASLAEVLETADLEVKLWHQVQQIHKDSQGSYNFPGTISSLSGRQVVAPPSEILLGSTTVPLKYLLLKRTGLHGWFTVTVPPNDGWATSQTNRDQHIDPTLASAEDDNIPSYQSTSHREGGSLELDIKFAQKSDREKVIEVGHRMGWSSQVSLDEEGHSDLIAVAVTLQIDKIMFHELSILGPGQNHLDDPCNVYIRYQFYDRRPTCSSLVRARVTHKGEVSVDMKYKQTIQLNMNPSLMWYLREESLEVQVWVSTGQDQPSRKDAKPRHKDKCIGSAHIGLTKLSIEGSRQHRISGLYPVSKPGRDNMFGASLRGSVTLQRGHIKSSPSQESVSESDSECLRFEAVNGSDQRTGKEEKVFDQQEHQSEETEEMLEPIPFELHIERAMGLSASPQRWNTTPLSSYVTLQVMDSDPFVTSTVTDSTRPVWNFYQEIILSPNEVVEKQHLIFKVWHQTTAKQDTSCDRMLGFTSVDLGPLLVGFRSLNGWYNIMDFSSQVKGQLKIAITPKRDLSSLKKKAVKYMSHMTSPNTSGFLPPLHSSMPAHLIPGFNRETSTPPVSAPRPKHHHHEQHHRGVKESHEKLRSLEKQPGSVLDDPSLSLLRENLKKNLADLDSLKETLDQKRRCLDRPYGVRFADGVTSTTIDRPDGVRLEDGVTSTTSNVPLDSIEPETNKLEHRKQREYNGTHPVQSGRFPDGSRDEVDKLSFNRFTERGGTSDTGGGGREGVRSGSPAMLHEIDKFVQYEKEETGDQFGEDDDRIDQLSEGQEESEEEKDGDIVIPRTLNDVLLDCPGEMETYYMGVEELKGDDNSNTGGSGGYETPEEALERIQNRILEVLSNNVKEREEVKDTFEKTETVEENPSLREEDEIVGEEGSHLEQHDGDLIDEDEGEDAESVLSQSSSGQEDLASFASSRDECDSEQISGRKLPEKARLGSPREIEIDDVYANTETFDVHTEARDEFVRLAEYSKEGERKTGKFEGNENQRQYHDEDMVDAGKETVPPSSITGIVQPTLESEPLQDEEKRGLNPEDMVSLHASSKQQTRRKRQDLSNPAVLELPNFFLPREDLASAMRTLDSAVSGAPQTQYKQSDTGSLSEKIQAAREVAQRMEKAFKEVQFAGKSLHPKKFAKKQPTAEEAKRIAKIFSAKYSPS